jgi:bifunctional NMN adenylyltransferase/nudix hydrolase
LKKGTGVIVGRFQVDTLTAGHQHLLKEATADHDALIIFIGCSPMSGTMDNPLDYHTREHMVIEYLRVFHRDTRAVVLPIIDNRCDKEWSKQLDADIRKHTAETPIKLYGGRDSFLPRYHGTFPTREITSVGVVPATDRRKRIAVGAPLSTQDFRSGVIYGVCKWGPRAFMAVDIAAVSENKKKVIMGKKPGETLWRFPGGFLDAKDKSLEEAAKRELFEETKFSISVEGPLTYISSRQIDDWRYRKSDRIITAFYMGYVSWGAPRAGDDLAEADWVPLTHEQADRVAPLHRPYFIDLLSYLKIKPKGKK